MKKTIFLLFSALLSNFVFAQHKEEAEALVAKGIIYHDKGDYEKAIAKYDQALELDADNLVALAEKSMSLMYMEKYEESILICERAIQKHKGETNLNNVYVTYGNALDGLHQAKKAIEVYDEGIKQFPDYYALYYNKAISLNGLKRFEEALSCFQIAASKNPRHASSHNGIGTLLFLGEQRIPALMAYSRFLTLEPEGDRAKQILVNLKKIMKGNTEVTGENSVTVHINSDMLSDTTAEGKNKENNFGMTDMILSMTASLDGDDLFKKETEVERFIRKFQTVCTSLEETRKGKTGFYWDYYVPYFIELYNNKYVETFAYVAFASSDDSKVVKWLKEHETELQEFFNWSNGFEWKTE